MIGKSQWVSHYPRSGQITTGRGRYLRSAQSNSDCTHWNLTSNAGAVVVQGWSDEDPYFNKQVSTPWTPAYLSEKHYISREKYLPKHEDDPARTHITRCVHWVIWWHGAAVRVRLPHVSRVGRVLMPQRLMSRLVMLDLLRNEYQSRQTQG